MKQRRSLWGCDHSSTITTITAGLAREVCERCGRIEVNYVEPVVQLHPSLDEPDRDGEVDVVETTSHEATVIFEDTTRLLTCGLCSQPAIFMIPDGLRCNEHAWQAAARLDWEAEDPWVPIRLDRSGNAL